MTAEWERDLAVDPEAVRRAAGSPSAWRLLGFGWDCDAWLADERVVWRAPRRAIAIECLIREACAMPRIAPRLTLPVPVPALVEVDGLPPLLRHELVPGREMAESDRVGSGVGAALGRFLRALHGPEIRDQAAPLLPVDPIGRADPARRIRVTQERLDHVQARLDVGPLRPMVASAAGPLLPTEVVCHGDLHVRHLMLDDAGELSGVIDWGDCCVSTPAVDLAIVTALDREGQEAFFRAYGPVEERTWRHARLIAVQMGAALLAADPEGASGRSARAWLERLIDQERANARTRRA